LTHIPEPDSSKPAPLTEEQLEFFTEQTRRVVDREVSAALRRYVRGAIVAYVLLVAALGYVLYSDNQQGADRRADGIAARHQIVNTGNAVALAGCNRDFRTIKSLRAVLTNARDFQNAALRRGDITKIQFNRAAIYYKAQLDKLTLPDCRLAAHSVSDNVNRPVPFEVPLYPHG
jgi:hypothetical protein